MINFAYLKWVRLLVLLSVARSAKKGFSFEVVDAKWNSMIKNFKSDIEVLHIKWKPIYTLTSSFCDTLPKVREFNAKGLEIKSIEENAFENCKELDHLDLYNNDIKTILPNILVHNSNLTWVSFVSNQLTDIPPQLFKNNTNLKTLLLQYNKLSVFPVGQMNELPMLKMLNLQGNKIVNHDLKMFEKKFQALRDVSIDFQLGHKNDEEELKPTLDNCQGCPDWVYILTIVFGLMTIVFNILLIYFCCKK